MSKLISNDYEHCYIERTWTLRCSCGRTTVVLLLASWACPCNGKGVTVRVSST